MSKIVVGLALLGGFLSSACAGVAEHEEDALPEETGEAQLPAGGINGYDGNNMKDASIANNSSNAQTLVNTALSNLDQTWTSTLNIRNAILSETASNNVFTHLVKCALSDGDVVTVNYGSSSGVFYGQYGLANAWETGSCDAVCQAKVSACVIAHSHKTNYGEDHIQFNMVNADWRGSSEFPSVEGLYFGNIFASSGTPQRILGCRTGSGTLISRVCDSTSNCSTMTPPMNTDLGWCGASYGCDGHYGSGTNSWDMWHNSCTVSGTTYNYPITVYRRTEVANNFTTVFYTKTTNRDGASVANWDYGYWKATCKNTEIMTGISVKTNLAAAHAALCETNSPTTASDSLVLNFPYDDRRASRLGDWDPGNWKLECPVNKRVSGVSQDNTVPSSNFHAIRCSGTDSTYDYATGCETRVVDGGYNDRGDTSAGNWDFGYYKAECSAGKTLVGVSANPSNYKLSKILCCTP